MPLGNALNMEELTAANYMLTTTPAGALWNGRNSVVDSARALGGWKNAHQTVGRSAEEARSWRRVFQHLAADADNGYCDKSSSTIVRAHQQHQHPKKDEDQAIGRVAG